MASLVALLASSLVGCGDDSGSKATADNNGLFNNGATNNGGTDNNGTNNGTDNNTVTPMCDESLTARPSPRAEMMGVFDPVRQRLVFFGGDEGVPIDCATNSIPVGGLWIYDAVCATFEPIPYETGPSPRARGAAVYDADGDQMIVFGGRYKAPNSGSTYTLYDEVWALDLDKLTWRELGTTGGGPGPRTNLAAEYWPETHELIVMGGNSSTNGANFSPHNDVWALNLDTAAWREVTASGSKPEARLFHLSGMDAEAGILYVYGGGGADAFFGTFFADLWAFDLHAGTWERLYNGGADGPVGRIWGSMTFFDGSLYVFGGHYDLDVQNDTWRFEPGNRSWHTITGLEDTSKEPGRCTLPVDFTNVNYDAPERRQGHLAAVDATRGEWVIFGGKTDCGAIDDVWAFDFNREAWNEIHKASIGESCPRQQDPTTCVAYCQ